VHDDSGGIAGFNLVTLATTAICTGLEISDRWVDSIRWSQAASNLTTGGTALQFVEASSIDSSTCRAPKRGPVRRYQIPIRIDMKIKPVFQTNEMGYSSASPGL
jgi:hypothetical protein